MRGFKPEEEASYRYVSHLLGIGRVLPKGGRPLKLLINSPEESQK